MPRVPCPARPQRITRNKYFEATLGKRKAKKFMDSERERTYSKQRRPENKAKKKILNDKMYKNNKEAYLQRRREQKRKFGLSA